MPQQNDDELAQDIWQDIGETATGDMARFMQCLIDAHSIAVEVARLMTDDTIQERPEEFMVWYILHDILHPFIGKVTTTIKNAGTCFEQWKEFTNSGLPKVVAAKMVASLIDSLE